MAVAGRQHGVISRPDLVALGLDRTQIHRLRTSGLLVPVGHRTLRVAGLPVTRDQRVLAACLDTGGVASHLTACRLVEVGSWPPEAVPAVTVHRMRRLFRSPLAEVHTTTFLPADDIVVIRGIPCTSVARTLVTLASPRWGLGSERVRDLVDEAIRDRKASDAWIWWRLERLRRRGRGGIRAMEAVLVDRSGRGRTESWLERETLRLIDLAGLPRPNTQQRIDRDGAFVGRVDLLWEDRKLVAEVTGHEFHASRDQRAADADRRNRLLLAGYQVLEFTYDDVVRHPERVIATLREALATR